MARTSKSNDHTDILDTAFMQRTCPCYLELCTMVKPFVATGTGVYNFVDQIKKISYNIPETSIPQFMRLLEECRRTGISIGFSESQNAQSGIMLDFDILQTDSKSQITDVHITTLIQHVMAIIVETIKIDTQRHIFPVMVTKKITLVAKEDLFKDGLHIVIPTIQLSKQHKRAIIDLINDRKIIEMVFYDVKFSNDYAQILDKNSAHVVVLMPGNSKHGGIAYAIHGTYNTMVQNGRVFSVNAYALGETDNITYAFSLAHTEHKGITKTKFDPVDGLITAAAEYVVPDPVNNDLSILTMHNPNAKLMRSILALLNVERCIDYMFWFRIVTALAYENPVYKPLALEFSGRRPRGVRRKFEQVWSDAIQNRYKYGFSKDMIIAYARQDDPEQCQFVLSSAYIGLLASFIFESKLDGRFEHWHIAKLLFEMIGNKFKVDYSKSTNRICWYEFIIEGDNCIHGEIYKWRISNDPYTIREYISQAIPKLFNMIMENIEERKSKATEESMVKYLSNIMRELKHNLIKLFNNGFKSGVIKECESVFRSLNFSDKLDMDPTLTGVGNGVLRFDKYPVLIKYPHSHLVSRYTAIDYVPIDIKDQLVLDVYKSIWTLFPEGEKCVMRYILYFMSTCLNGRVKDAKILMLEGCGSNGKSYMTELLRNTFASVDDMGYTTKMPIQFLSEGERDSNNATPALVSLEYARLVLFSEPEKGTSLRASKLKLLTSQEVIPVRALYGAQRNVTSKGNLIMSTNHRYRTQSNENALWRRICIAVYKMLICNNPDPDNKYEMKVDPSLTKEKTRNPKFLAAFLSILTMYYTVLENDHNGDLCEVESKVIIYETEMYRNSQDVMNRFITGRMVKSDAKASIAIPEVVDAYCRWYNATIKESQHDRLDISMMIENSRLGKHITKKSNGQSIIHGFRILGPEEEKGENEEYIVDVINNPSDTPTAPVTMEMELNKMHEAYTRIMKTYIP
jgi:phage/plasmid-associated DNA primase